MRLVFLAVVVAALTGGCAYPKKTKLFEPGILRPEKSRVYLYRTKTQIHSVNPDVPKFYVGDRLIGRLLIGGYYLVEVDPGEHEIYYKVPLFGITFPWKSGKLKVQLKPGETAYVKFAVEFGLGPVTIFRVMPANAGEQEIRQTQLLEN
jgi:hypothetical protein